MSLPVKAVLVALLCWCANSVEGLAELPHHARGGLAQRLREAALHRLGHRNMFSDDAQYIDLPLDHFSPTSKTFPNRFYMNDTFFDKNKPICFLLLGGEGPVDGIGTNYVTDLASRYKALIVAMEHRFYGESVPNNDFSTENLKYLTTRQALADVASVLEYITAKVAMQGCTWFTFGGSYSGALSAWFRLKYPALTRGSLSSSGVVNAIFEFTAFDAQVAEAIGTECSNAVRLITSTFEGAISKGQGPVVKALFNSPPNMLDADFFYMLADSAAMADQYGHKTDLCNWVSNLSLATDPEIIMESFANFTQTMWGADFGANCFYDTDCLKNDPSKWQPTSRSWRWQKCHELAYLQAAPITESLRSHLVNMPYMLEQCVNIFGPGIVPLTNATNAYYGGVHPDGSNIFFSDFSDDPWQRASMNETISASLPYRMTTCTGCGHCMDLHAPSSDDPTALVATRSLFESYLTKWLQ